MTPAEKISRARRLLQEANDDLARALANQTTRKRGELLRQIHNVQSLLHPSYPYVSQAGQDRIVDRLLDGKRDGVFVDVGGYDGVTGSNTLFFEFWRGWTGLLIEPVRSSIEKAKLIRRCASINCAVSGVESEAEFIEITSGYTQMSGLASSYDPKILARVRADERHHETTRKLRTKCLATLLEQQEFGQIDFVSLDIEGGELPVLSGFPFEQFNVTIWAIENSTGSPEINALMAANGYDLVDFAGHDEIYKRRSTP